MRSCLSMHMHVCLLVRWRSIPPLRSLTVGMRQWTLVDELSFLCWVAGLNLKGGPSRSDIRGEELLLLSTEGNQLRFLKNGHGQHVLTSHWEVLGLEDTPGQIRTWLRVMSSSSSAASSSCGSCRRKQRTVWSFLWRCCPHDKQKYCKMRQERLGLTSVTRPYRDIGHGWFWKVPFCASLWDQPSLPYLQFLFWGFRYRTLIKIFDGKSVQHLRMF